MVQGSWDMPAFERTLAALLPGRMSEGPRDHGWDIATAEGLFLQTRLHSSTRDLQSALLNLAYTANAGRWGRVVLVGVLPRMSAARAREEWARFLRLMPPKLRGRIGLVALASDRDDAIPDDPELQRVKALAREALKRRTAESEPDASSPWSQKQFEVWRVMLAAWLRNEPPLQIRELQQRSGTHYSTVASTLERLQRKDEIARASNRSVELARLPHASLTELVSVGEPFRRSRRYVDGSGRAADPVALVKRLGARAPAGVALGGVVAARHYVHDFNLNGLPRVDVTVSSGGLEWVPSVNAALERAPQGASPLLVVHRLDRPAALFDEGGRGRLPFADPAEVLLDLYELHLTEQADDFVRAMRRNKKTHE